MKRPDLQITDIKEGEETRSQAQKAFSMKSQMIKPPSSKEGGADQGIRSIQKPKQTGSEKKVPSA